MSRQFTSALVKTYSFLKDEWGRFMIYRPSSPTPTPSDNISDQETYLDTENESPRPSSPSAECKQEPAAERNTNSPIPEEEDSEKKRISQLRVDLFLIARPSLSRSQSAPEPLNTYTSLNPR